MQRSLYHPLRKLITPEGLANLNALIESLERELSESRTASSDRGARSVGTCNGCSVTDDVTRQHELLRARIDGLNMLRRASTKIDSVPSDKVELGIGHVATFKYWTLEPGRRSKENRVQMQIVGLHEEDPLSVPPRISYQTPLAQAFLEMRVGTVEDQVLIAGARRTVTLTAIRFPGDKGVIRVAPAVAAPEPELPVSLSA